MKITKEQAQINRELTKRKKWLIMNEPFCIFCGGWCGNSGQLAHKIRRSYVSSKYTRVQLQTMPENIGLSHHECHYMFDNKHHEAKKYLKNFDKILSEIQKIDEGYYNQYLLNLKKKTAL